ncbi:MAG: multiheme c-type cytochrome [Nitrospiraceae bacterium]
MVRYPRILHPATIIAGTLLLLLCGIWGLLALISPAASAESKPSLGQAFPRAEACKGCHERVFEEWEASPYARSIHSPAFRVLMDRYLAFSKGKDKGFCFRCHAPHILEYGEQTEQFISEVQSGGPNVDGIGCTQCHLIKDVDLTGHPPGLTLQLERTMFGPYDNPVKNLAHKSVKLDLYQKPAFCLSCHQPAPTVTRLGPEANLIGHWQEASKADKSCQSCHMREQFGESANGQKARRIVDHAFTARHGVRRQPAAELAMAPAVQGDQTTITVTIKNRAPHKLPMAHPGWARLTLDLTIKGKNLKKVYGEQRHYKRVYADAKGEETVFDFAATKLLADTTLKPAEERVETFTFPTPKDTRSFDAVLMLMYAPISGPPDFLETVEALATQGKEDPVFKPIPLAIQQLNVPLG